MIKETYIFFLSKCRKLPQIKCSRMGSHLYQVLWFTETITYVWPLAWLSGEKTGLLNYGDFGTPM